jgi:hypothetical protein
MDEDRGTGPPTLHYRGNRTLEPVAPRDFVVILPGAAVGAVLWFWVVSLAFTRSYTSFLLDAAFPLLFVACTAALLSAGVPRLWLWCAAGVCAPIVVLNLTCFSMLTPEGKQSATPWLYLNLPVLAVAFAGAAVGRFLSNRHRDKEKGR